MFPNTKKTFSYLTRAVFVSALYFILYTLYQVFSGFYVLPQSFSFGIFTIYFYGVCIALAAAAGFCLALARAKKFGIEKKLAEDILFWTIIAGFIGARIYHIFSSWQFYLNHPVDILKVWNGGLSIYGAVFGGVLFLALCRKLFTFHFSLFTLFNWLTPSLILGQIIGRFGNLFNYELFGYPTNLPWGMFVPNYFRPVNFVDQSFFHPLFLYEQLGLLAIYVLLSKIQNLKLTKNFNLFLSYLLLYNVLGFGLEFLRIDAVYLGNIRQNALVSLVTALISLLLIYSSLNHKQSLNERNG